MPLTQIRAFHRPDHIEGAWHLLQEGPEVRLVGGGSELAIRCPSEVQVLVDLAHLGLDRIDAALPPASRSRAGCAASPLPRSPHRE